jgi:hypothetical protein
MHCALLTVSIKDADPIQLAKYAQANQLLHEPAFAWWAPFVLERKDRIIDKVKTKYWMILHKYGIWLPKSVVEAFQIDRQDANDLWCEAIEKEMKNGTPEEAGKQLVGYQFITCHMIFDAKIENFTRKARFVAGGHTTEPPQSITYSNMGQCEDRLRAIRCGWARSVDGRCQQCVPQCRLPREDLDDSRT